MPKQPPAKKKSPEKQQIFVHVGEHVWKYTNRPHNIWSRYLVYLPNFTYSLPYTCNQNSSPPPLRNSTPLNVNVGDPPIARTNPKNSHTASLHQMWGRHRAGRDYSPKNQRGHDKQGKGPRGAQALLRHGAGRRPRPAAPLARCPPRSGSAAWIWAAAEQLPCWLLTERDWGKTEP